jgi:Family of unknown function (DUF6152)
MNYRLSSSLALGILLLAGTAWAHHNMSALYDFNNRVAMTGTLTKFDWRNPHIELIVDAKGDKDQMETWTLEGPPPSFFRNRNVSKSDFEGAFGKIVTFEASRARDGSKAGLLRTMTLPGGKVVSACPQNC